MLQHSFTKISNGQKQMEQLFTDDHASIKYQGMRPTETTWDIMVAFTAKWLEC